MAQVTNGILLGSPGIAGSAGVYILVESGPPANNSDPLVVSASLGSLYLDYLNGLLYVKQSGGWTAK